ncbi:MAG: MarR family transcriptional regulator [Rhodocyclaceae bacterium]
MTMSMSLAVLRRGYRAAADRAVAHLGVSQALAWPMLMVGRLGPGVRQGAVADALAIEGSSLVRLIDQLVHLGLVLRHEDATDRRARTLHLTEQGAAIVARIEAALHEFRERLYRDISDEDIATCLRVFAKLEDELGVATPDMARLCPGASAEDA